MTESVIVVSRFRQEFNKLVGKFFNCLVSWIIKLLLQYKNP